MLHGRCKEIVNEFRGDCPEITFRHPCCLDVLMVGVRIAAFFLVYAPSPSSCNFASLLVDDLQPSAGRIVMLPLEETLGTFLQDSLDLLVSGWFHITSVQRPDSMSWVGEAFAKGHHQRTKFVVFDLSQDKAHDCNEAESEDLLSRSLVYTLGYADVQGFVTSTCGY